MFENHGEDYDGDRGRCPGDGKCDIWDAAGGTYEERASACADCKRCSGPPIEPTGHDPTPDDDETIEDLVDEIADVVFYQDAGSATEWEAYPPEYLYLVGNWRAAEKMCRMLQRRKLLEVMTNAGT